MKNLEHLITEANTIDTLDELYVFVDNMIDQYSTNKQSSIDKHKAMLKSIKSTVEMGIGNKLYLEKHAREKLFTLIGNVCLEQKVIK